MQKYDNMLPVACRSVTFDVADISPIATETEGAGPVCCVAAKEAQLHSATHLALVEVLARPCICLQPVRLACCCWPAPHGWHGALRGAHARGRHGNGHALLGHVDLQAVACRWHGGDCDTNMQRGG
jgi:hypothetical protein